MKKEYTFCALISRMKYINRWGLMRSSRTETLSEHTAETAILAHVLALLACKVFDDKSVRPEKVAAAALYHDASEILTGDLPTPVKYKNEELQVAYKKIEKESASILSQMAPPEIQQELHAILRRSDLNAAEKQLVKAADKLSALIKCVEEDTAGNSEFCSAKKQQLMALEEMQNPVVNYFLKHMLPSYQKNLDELTQGV